jgi:hypothetical protein
MAAIPSVDREAADRKLRLDVSISRVIYNIKIGGREMKTNKTSDVLIKHLMYCLRKQRKFATELLSSSHEII